MEKHMKFEYDELIDKGLSRVTVDILNEKGAEGWEIITCFNGPNGNRTYLMKRELVTEGKKSKKANLKEVG